MLTVNMNRPLSPRKPTRIAKGPDIDKFDIKKPEVPPVPPQRDWQREQLYFSQPRAKYNMYGNFDINRSIAGSHRAALRNMHNDIAMFGMTDQLRKPRYR